MVSEHLALMESSSASTNSSQNPLLGAHIFEKSNRSNFTLWKAQVLTMIRGARLEGYVTGKTTTPEEQLIAKKTDDTIVTSPNPAFKEWYVQDQQVLGLIFSSVRKEVLGQIAAASSAAQAWREVERMFSAQTRARTMNVRFALTTTRKGNLSIAEYFAKIKSYADEMLAAGKPLDDEELVSHICNGLDPEYNLVITAVAARIEPISVSELYAQLLSFETRLDLQDGGASMTAHVAGRSWRTNFQERGSTNGRGRSTRGRWSGRMHGAQTRGPSYQRHGGNSTDASRFNNADASRVVCQVCFKKGHTANKCWHRFEENYVPDDRLVVAAVSSYNIDNNWYIDTGATDHIIGELEKLSVREKYKGNDQIHTASGAGSSHEEHTS